MINISTRIDRSGFWYSVESSEPVQFQFLYIAFGSAGRQSSGEISGTSDSRKGWQFVEVGFPLLHMGITSLQAGFGDAVSGSTVSTRLNEPSRSAAMIALASTTLSGGLLLSGSGVSMPDLLKTRDSKIQVAANTPATCADLSDYENFFTATG